MNRPPSDLGIVPEIMALLAQHRATVAVAESLTGGLVAAELTAVPGASHAVRGSITAYATDLKSTILGVDPEILAGRGPVDPDVAVQMAAGARQVLAADYGVATTGVAGPEPQGGKAVGTVFVAVIGPAGSTVISPALAGDRDSIRRGAVRAALSLLRNTLRSETDERDAEQRGNGGYLQP